mgnify:CR=1 FL=1
MQALKSGKHVLIEKPFALLAKAAKLLFEEASKEIAKSFPIKIAGTTVIFYR